MKPSDPTHAYCPECRSSAVRLKHGGAYETHRRAVETMYTRQSKTERCPGSGTAATAANIARWVAWELGGARTGAANASERLRIARAALADAERDDAAARARLAAIDAIAKHQGAE
jgi:hypothetical protein